MNVLLKEALTVPVSSGRTSYHRGKYRGDKPNGATVGTYYAERSVETYMFGLVKTYSNQIRTEKLVPIQRRLQLGLDLQQDDFIEIPTYFELPVDMSAPLGSENNQTVAETVGMVNMQVVNGHLMVPRPFGPRLSVADATAVLRRTFDRLGMTSVAVRTPPDTGYWFWAHPGETLDRLASYFTHPPSVEDRNNIINHITIGMALSPSNLALVTMMKGLILGDIRNWLCSDPVFMAVNPSSGEFLEWVRVWIPEPRVDLLEAYVLSVLEPLGLTVHFIDDWFYHVRKGEVHCGTNAKRRPPELDSGRRWWDDYDPDYDTGYDPAS
jgi:hypothetical protein